MSTTEFVHLHAHSDYSLLDGCARFANEKGEPTPQMERLSRMGFTHQALTDHGNLFGAVEFYQCCEMVGLKPIVGCELYVASGSRFDRKGKEEEHSQKIHINHLTVLARNNEGYQNLIELVSRASLEGFYYKPRVDKELLSQYAKGLVALSGCLKGEVAQALLKDSPEEATKRIATLESIFGKGNFYLELMDHGLDAQKKVNQALLDIARQTGLPLVATNDCHYFLKEDAPAHDAHLCIGTGKKIEDANRMRYATQEFYYKSPEEMTRLFSLHPEAIKNSVAIAKSTEIKLSFNELHLPEYQVPQGFTQESYLMHLCRDGLKLRFPAGAPKEYQERLEYEFAIIKKLGFPGYFLIVWDFINFARQNGVPVGPGRGSGAGSLISYLLNITSVDPIKFGLLFERFLNPDRRTMPDLDIDFSDAGRELVITYVREKYGFSNVAQIITFGTMQSRLAVRDVGRVLNIPIAEVDKIAKTIPQGATIETALQNSQEFRSLYETSDTVKNIVAIALKLEGARRHTGVHAAGTVITKEPVTKYTPMFKNTTSGVVTTGYNDESLIKLGLLKVDFLGLRTLTVIAETIKLIEQTKNIVINTESIPFDDPAAYALLSRAQTGGVFQLESRGMRDLLMKLRPSKLTDIIALIALFRPGPMKWIDEFVGRKYDPARIRYEHPLLEPILKETYGICVYQEQVMEIAKRLAGFTGGQADHLRKAMGKKIPAELNKMEELFIEGARQANNIDPKFSKKLYADLKDFGHYAFNKSHSAAYGIIAYQTAYLKANYPMAFMTALVTSEIGRTAVGSEDRENKISVYLREAKTMGIGILPPAVNHSESKFSIENNNIRYGLLAVKNVGETSANDIVLERRRSGPYKSLKDFLTRASKAAINRKVLESLAKAGALDELLEGDATSTKRARFLRDLDSYIEFYSQEKGGLLFEIEFTPAQNASGLLSADEVRQGEREVLGMFLSEHPLQGWQSILQKLPFRSIGEIHNHHNETKTASAGDKKPWRHNFQAAGAVALTGLIVSVRKQISKKTGGAWARLILEDLSGNIDVVLFPKTFAKTNAETLKPGQTVVVAGRLARPFLKNDTEDNEANPVEEELIADEVLPLEDYLKERVVALRFALQTAPEPADLERLKKIIEGAPPGPTRLLLTLNQRLAVELPKTIKIENGLWRELEGLFQENPMILEVKKEKMSYA